MGSKTIKFLKAKFMLWIKITLILLWLERHTFPHTALSDWIQFNHSLNQETSDSIVSILWLKTTEESLWSATKSSKETLFAKTDSAGQWPIRKFTTLQSGDKTLTTRWKIWAKKWQTGVKTLAKKWMTGLKTFQEKWKTKWQILLKILTLMLLKMMKILFFLLFELIKNLMN